MLGLSRSQVVSFEVELRLQFLDLLEVLFKIADIHLGHNFSIAVAYFGVDLANPMPTWGLCSFRNYVNTLYLPSTFFCII